MICQILLMFFCSSVFDVLIRTVFVYLCGRWQAQINLGNLLGKVDAAKEKTPRCQQLPAEGVVIPRLQIAPDTFLRASFCLG